MSAPEHFLTDDDRRRYARQLCGLDGFTQASQLCLRRARVLLVGVGGLGSAAAYYLAASGVGTLGLADPDCVELSNLQRQILHTTADIGRRKTASAAARLQALNPAVRLECHDDGLTDANAVSLCADYDLILDCSDNFPTRYRANDGAFFAGKPLVQAGVSGYAFHCAVFDCAHGSCCLRCALPAAPDETPQGVSAPVVGMAGAYQAGAAISLLCGLGGARAGTLFHFDMRASRARTLALARDEDCPLCGKTPKIKPSCPQKKATP